MKLGSNELVFWREQLSKGQADLDEKFHKHSDARCYLSGRADLVDKIICQIWSNHQLPADWALIAVGGYGRKKLYPASDIDLLILLTEERHTKNCERLGELISFLWDIGLQIGHSVRTIHECTNAANHDITIQTALVEARLLTGNGALFSSLQDQLNKQLNPQLFYKAKQTEQQDRHLRYQDTASSLEPNCKESPGGLRDLHVVLWLARAYGIGDSWKALEKHGFLTHAERQKIERCANNLALLRIRLHLLAKRREDRLLFEYQNALASEFGIHGSSHKLASELLMQRYYRTAITVRQISTILMQNIGTWVFPAEKQPHIVINERFHISGELLDVVSEDVFKQHPPAIFEAFSLMQEHSELHGMTARMLRALWRARLLIDQRFRQSPENQARFLSLLKSPRGVVHEFRRMNQYGILGRYLPVFGRIVGQMQHDLFHVFTVDQHILQVIRNLRRLTIPKFAHEYPLLSRLIADFDKPWLLYIAALFHDIAKGRGGNHSKLGAIDALHFCQQHGLDEKDSQLVFWLVQEHLTLSIFAQKNDITDPEVIAAFAGLVGDEYKLNALYLLTVADIRGTSPKVWNAWKSKLLEDLFISTKQYLQADAIPHPQGVIEKRQQQAINILRPFALPDVIRERVWKLLDTVYFLRHEAEEIAWHTKNLHYHGWHDDRPIVRARMTESEGGIQVMVYTRSQPKLFVQLASFFACAGFSIADAKIHTTSHGYALDSFIIFAIDPGWAEVDKTKWIEDELCKHLHYQLPIGQPPKIRPSRQVRHLPIKPQVIFESDERPDHFVMTIAAADRPGLLFIIANILANYEIDIHTAKIATLGELVEDVFLISGKQLSQISERLNLENDILTALQS